jgi:hypothetical protein
LTTIVPYNLRIWIPNLRTSNLKIPIETGKWRNIPVEERIYVIFAMKIAVLINFVYLDTLCNIQEYGFL